MLFVDQITPSSFLQMWRFSQSAQTIWCFEAVSLSMQRWIERFRRLGLLRAEIRQINYHVDQVRDEAGNGKMYEVSGYSRSICTKIRKEKLDKSPLLKAMGSEWPLNKLVFYFEKLAEEEVCRECWRIALVKWIIETQLHISLEQCVLLIERKQWFSYLKAHAQSQGIKLAVYGNPWSPKRIIKTVFRLFRINVRAPSSVKPTAKHQSDTSTIAMRYCNRKLSFDPTERSEFFWLNGSDIPYSGILLYDYITDKPLDIETLNQLNARDIKLLGQGPGIPVWSATPGMVKVLWRIKLKIILSFLTCLVHMQNVSLYYIDQLSWLAREYAYWYDFYSANRVRMNVATAPYITTAQVLALDALKGVCVVYQYSIADINSPAASLSAGENVNFVFSFFFERLLRSLQAPVDYFVHTGYIYDSAIRKIGDLDRTLRIRKQIQDKGARFILCFFDENTRKENTIIRWDSLGSHGVIDDYEYLLKWLLADSSLGIIFKPKKYANELQKIPSISGLIERAKETGRCKFLVSDSLIGSIYPAEAALIADVSIGKLDNSTAALEAYLAGRPAVLIDTQNLHSHPFSAWGRERIVFNGWVFLRNAVEKYRAAPEAYPEFGDWSPVINDLDPFRDGKATLRMASYIRWVYDGLKEGSSKQEALANASERFFQEWGKQL